jgi:hypothetical protein
MSGRGEPDDRVAAVVGPAVEPGLDQRDAVAVPVAADVADDGQVPQLLEGGSEGAVVVEHPPAEPLLLDQVEVGQGHRTARPAGPSRWRRPPSSETSAPRPRAVTGGGASRWAPMREECSHGSAVASAPSG